VCRELLHGFCDEKLVVLKLTVRDFRCRKCGLFRENIPGIDRRKTTERFRTLVIPKIHDRSFSAVAKEFGLSVSSLIRSSRELKQDIGVIWSDKPFDLGIDEHSFSGHDLMITLTNLSEHKLLEILRNDQNTTLTYWLRQIPENTKKSIKTVCIDMKAAYRSVVQKELPGVPIVVDKFHVIQNMNIHLLDLRQLYTNSSHPLPKRLFEKNKEDLNEKEKFRLDKIFKQYPPIAEFWRMKEIMRNIYRTKDPKKATERLDDLIRGLEFDTRPRWQELYRTLTNWRTEILNYFNNRITNAYTEGVHTKIKLLKRISYGFRNRTNYIAKMTLSFLPLATIIETLIRTNIVT
jgi:transposase